MWELDETEEKLESSIEFTIEKCVSGNLSLDRSCDN